MNDRIAFLSKVDIFSRFEPEDMAKVAGVLEERVYEKRAHIFSQGDPGGTVYLIWAGVVHITRKQPKGGAVVLARLSQGEIFGEMSYFDGRLRSADAVAATKASLFVADRPVLDRLFADDLSLANKILLGIIRKMSERLKKVDDQLEGFQDLIRYF